MLGRGKQAITGADVKGKRRVIRAAGMMSGTSLDGVDLAVIETDGVDVFSFAEVGYRSYTDAERDVLRAALGKWPGEEGVAEAAAIVEDAHIDLASGLEGVELLGFHGQTLAHDPKGHRTHQAGDGARVAEALGIDTVWDFRSADVALGGQGAPLAPFYHWACARWVGLFRPAVFLNLGGVGNLTWINTKEVAPDLFGALLAFDTGPGNAPMDDLMMRRGLGRHDEGGALAAKGTPDANVLEAFIETAYFDAPPPKSLDRSDFSALTDAVADLSTQDALATLAECITGAVAMGFAHLPSVPSALYVTGGGRHNKHLMDQLTELLPCPVASVEALGLDGDKLEAQAFAYLATRIAGKLPTSAPGTTGVGASVSGGIISRVTASDAPLKLSK